MPRYYFHYQYSDEDRVLEDHIGTQIADIESVEDAARSIAFEILSDELQQGGAPDTPRCLQVEDEAGEVVLYLPFWGALAIPLAHRARSLRH